MNNHPTCPHCGYEFDEDETWHTGWSKHEVYNGDGEESELVCHNLDCQKEFKVVCVHEIKWEAREDD